MASRIGGPQTTPLTVNYGLTWGSMRGPILLGRFGRPWGASLTVFSRAYPDTTGAAYPKFFIWESGSPFRLEPPGIMGAGVLPEWAQYNIFSQEDPNDPTLYGTAWNIGNFAFNTYSVDNQDFDQLIGEDLDTDIGTFAITADAHDPILGQQVLEVGGIIGGNEIYAIGKLTPV